MIVSHGWWVRCMGLGCFVVQIECSWKYVCKTPQAETDEVVEWMAEPAAGGVNGTFACDVWALNPNTQICNPNGNKCRWSKWCFVWPACSGDILPVLAALLAVFGKALLVDQYLLLLLLVGLWSSYSLIQYKMQTWSWLNNFIHLLDGKILGIVVNTIALVEMLENEFVVSALLKETLWVKFEYWQVILKCKLSPGKFCSIVWQPFNFSLWILWPLFICIWRGCFCNWMNYHNNGMMYGIRLKKHTNNYFQFSWPWMVGLFGSRFHATLLPCRHWMLKKKTPFR